MLLADKKLNTDVSEYIVYMYQTEHILRSLKLDTRKIKKYIEEVNTSKEKDKELLTKWMIATAKQMKKEKLAEKGHLSDVVELTKKLSKLNMHLIRSDKAYRQQFDACKLYIIQYSKQTDGLIDPIEVCLEGVFQSYLNSTKLEFEEFTEDKVATRKFKELLSKASYKYAKNQRS